jgi:hypothetical protein
MNGWQLATDVAIWTLILGSMGIFGWFLSEVVRLSRTWGRPRRDGGGSAGDGTAGEGSGGAGGDGAEGGAAGGAPEPERES